MDIYKILETMQKFAGEPEQKPGEQWQGRDAGTPGTKLVGESDQPMSLTDKLRARWEETKRAKGLQEYGMTTGGTAMGGGTAPVTADPAQQAKDATIAKTNLNKLSGAGINPAQATKAISSIETDPSKPLASTDLQQTKTLTDLVGDALSDPQKGNQLSTILQQVAKQQGRAQ